MLAGLAAGRWGGSARPFVRGTRSLTRSFIHVAGSSSRFCALLLCMRLGGLASLAFHTESPCSSITPSAHTYAYVAANRMQVEMQLERKKAGLQREVFEGGRRGGLIYFTRLQAPFA